MPDTSHSPLPLPTGTWQLDPGATDIKVTAKKLGFFSVTASLDLTGGRVIVSDDHAVTLVEAEVDAGSYRSANDKRNEHVVSDDFLDAETHRSIGFAATSADAASSGHSVSGTLTIKGRSIPFALDVHDLVINGDRASFAAEGTVDRNAAGVGKLPSLVIGSAVRIDVAATAHRTGGQV